MNTTTNSEQVLMILAPAMLAKRWSGHDVRSEPEEGDEGGDAGELVPGREIRLTDITLNDEQIDALLGELATQAFFTTVQDKPRERAFTSFSRIRLDDKYKNCEAKIVFGLANHEITIDRATIKNLSLRFEKNAVVQLSCTIVGPRPRSLEMLELEEFGGKIVNVSISFGPVQRDSEEQQALNLQQPPVDNKSKAANDDTNRQADHDRQLEEAARGLEAQAAA
jgi:hypothetical protein